MESISGIITKINYYNPENGYTVVILELDYKDKTIAMKKSKIVGNTIALVGYFDREPHEMEEYTFNGDFVKDQIMDYNLDSIVLKERLSKRNKE